MQMQGVTDVTSDDKKQGVVANANMLPRPDISACTLKVRRTDMCLYEASPEHPSVRANMICDIQAGMGSLQFFACFPPLPFLD